MAFGGFSQAQNSQPMAEINMVPLIDVMLVLLVIFIIAAPMLTHAVKVELPKANSSPETIKPETVNVSIDATGLLFWNEQAVDKITLQRNMQQASKQPIPPLLRIRADGAIAYKDVAQVMSDAASAGLTKLAFVTEPASQKPL
ncbi:MAG: ExbD/TolR family protein [Methylophilaceae bacterium]